jgi:GR25 family glycosyltransferase involved in LPS biosynthesis
VEGQLKSIGINTAERFSAIKLENGAIGCSMSHLKCLQTARDNNWSYVMIVEDDISFTKPKLFLSQLNKFLQKHKSWDVILLAGNNIPPYKQVDDTCIRVGSCQTTTGYIVASHYYDILIQNFHEGIQKLLTYPHLATLYAIDKYWFSLQKKHYWYLIIPLTVTQREDYSDIEKKQVNYTSIMVDIDKDDFIQRQKVIQTIQSSMPSFPAIKSPLSADKKIGAGKHMLNKTMGSVIGKK